MPKYEVLGNRSPGYECTWDLRPLHLVAWGPNYGGLRVLGTYCNHLLTVFDEAHRRGLYAGMV